MSATTEAVRDMEKLFTDGQYPREFLEKYDPLECLASHRGMETILVREKSGRGQFVAKCYDKALYSSQPKTEILQSLRHDGLPGFADAFQNNTMLYIVREYIEGTPLNQYAAENALSRQQIVSMCVKLCDIFIYLHESSVIHRDIKPQNIILRDNGEPVLIDFDAARIFKAEADTDTRFLGTKGYAPPEQYGFAQTDCRADIYSLGVLLRFLLTDSARDNPNVRVYPPLSRVIAKCTAFSGRLHFYHHRGSRRCGNSPVRHWRNKQRREPRAASSARRNRPAYRGAYGRANRRAYQGAGSGADGRKRQRNPA